MSGLEIPGAVGSSTRHAHQAIPTVEATHRAEVIRLVNSLDGRYWHSHSQDASAIWGLTDSMLVAAYKAIDNLRAWTRLYGLTGGFTVAAFGNKSVWKMQAGVLGPADPPSLEFKKIIEDESSRIGISGAIITQAAITALSLPNLSQTHWAARASWIFSLVSALLAVYYAGNQVWNMGRLSRPNQIRAWIRHGQKDIEHVLAEVKTLDDRGRLKSIVRSLAPAPSSVLTVSAPRLLLSASLKSLLIGLGIYLGFVWTRGLDISAGPNDSRNVFIVYLVGLSVCYGVYALSGINQDKETSATVRGTIRESLMEFLTGAEQTEHEQLEQRMREREQWMREREQRILEKEQREQEQRVGAGAV